jgi:hypothetical protein
MKYTHGYFDNLLEKLLQQKLELERSLMDEMTGTCTFFQFAQLNNL